MNFYPFNDIETISPRPDAVHHGRRRSFPRVQRRRLQARCRAEGTVSSFPDAGHVDLYDRVNLIPFDKLTAFFTKNLKEDSRLTVVK